MNSNGNRSGSRDGAASGGEGMEKSERKYGPSTKARLMQLLFLCAIGVLINRLGSILAGCLPLPLYLDGLGTVLVAALGGYVPGIVVGYLINIINGISDPASAYYGVLSVMIAVATVVIADKGWFRKPAGCAGAVVIYAFIGGGLGSVLTWFLYGMGFGRGSAPPWPTGSMTPASAASSFPNSQRISWWTCWTRRSSWPWQPPSCISSRGSGEGGCGSSSGGSSP